MSGFLPGLSLYSVAPSPTAVCAFSLHPLCWAPSALQEPLFLSSYPKCSLITLWLKISSCRFMARLVHVRVHTHINTDTHNLDSYVRETTCLSAPALFCLT